MVVPVIKVPVLSVIEAPVHLLLFLSPRSKELHHRGGIVFVLGGYTAFPHGKNVGACNLKVTLGTEAKSALNKVSTKSGLNTICRLNRFVISPVKLRNSFKEKYFHHLTRVLVRFPETKCMSKFTVPHFSRGESVLRSSLERM